jgi:hypothetical protein
MLMPLFLRPITAMVIAQTPWPPEQPLPAQSPPAQSPPAQSPPAQSPPSVLPPPPVALPPNTRPNDRSQVCPATITALTPAFLRDLPSYANRVIVRNQTAAQMKFLPSVVIAGQAEHQPLPVVAENSVSDPQVQQLFFTTLERQRVGDRLLERQQFHWLLLTSTSQGWQMVQSYTRSGDYPRSEGPLTPPRESSDGTIAQAAKLWFRDCQAGAVRFADDRRL